MSDPLTDLITDVQHNGVRWVTVVTMLALYRKERRNHLLNRRDAALFHNQRIIMQTLGVGDQWKDGPKLGYQLTDLPNLKLLSIMLWKATQQKKLLYPRRKKKMKLLLNNPWSKKLFAFLLLVIVNGLNDTLGFHLTPETVGRITTLGGTYIVAQASVDTIKPIILYIVGLIESKSATPIVPVKSDPNTFIQG